MSDHFFEIVLEHPDEIYADRYVVADPLAAALKEAGSGKVTGGGSAPEFSIIEVEAKDFSAYYLIRQILRELQVDASTKINYYNDSDGRTAEYKIYD